MVVSYSSSPAICKYCILISNGLFHFFRLLENVVLDDSLLPAVTNWSISQRDKFQAVSGFTDEHIYVNYAIGDEGPAAWWSEANLPKLRHLKAQWDPHNLFGRGYPLQ